VLIVLGLRWLPPRIEPKVLQLSIPRSVWLRRSRDMTIAVVGGLAMAALTLRGAGPRVGHDRRLLPAQRAERSAAATS